MSVEINSDKDQKGRVKSGKRLKEGNQNQAPGKIAFNSFSSFECFSSSSILFSFCYCLSHIEFLLPLYLIPTFGRLRNKYYLAMANIGGLHLNIESSTNNVIDGRHLIINQ